MSGRRGDGRAGVWAAGLSAAGHVAAVAVLSGVAGGAAAQTLIWADEFNTLNTTVWQPMIGDGTAVGLPAGWGNNELQYYTNRSQNVRIENGELVIEARRENFSGFNYTSARLRTMGQRDFGYSRIEARMKLPSTRGIWPAFWMLPTGSPYGGWASSGEIDIMEATNIADRVYGTIHFGAPWPNNQSRGVSTTMSAPFDSEYHVFRVDWYPDRLEWYVDDVLYSRLDSGAWTSSAAPNNDRAPFDHQRFHLLLNVAVGGNFPGSPDGSSVFPQQMRVDWVRVYSLPDPKQPFLGTPVNLPGTIEMENYDLGGQGVSYNEADGNNNGGQYRNGEAVDIEGTAGGGFNVGWMRAGEWIEYTANLATAADGPGRYRVRARVATPNNGASFRLEVNGQDATGVVNVPRTGGWQTWQEVTFTMNTPVSGQARVRLVNLGADAAGFNIDRMTFTPTLNACGGDFDGNGVADFFDVLAYLERWDERSPFADFLPSNNPDGQFTTSEISALLALVGTGCP